MSKSFMINRRTALGGAAAFAAGAALPADAQDNKRIVVGTWGGDYSRLLAKNIETPLLAPKGWDVVKDEANDPPRRALDLLGASDGGAAKLHHHDVGICFIHRTSEDSQGRVQA